jgi:hypothetical protein
VETIDRPGLGRFVGLQFFVFYLAVREVSPP